MAKIVYILCALTSIGCAILLLKSYRISRAKLLFWSGACFVCLGLSNIALYLDLAVIADHDLSVFRSLLTLSGLLMLLYGLIWETS